MRCLYACGCTSDEECPHFDCGDPACGACHPVEPTTDQEEDALVSLTSVVLLFPCPRCGEFPSYPCRDKHDRPSGDPHVERWAVARHLGRIPALTALPAYLTQPLLEGASS